MLVTDIGQLSVVYDLTHDRYRPYPPTFLPNAQLCPAAEARDFYRLVPCIDYAAAQQPALLLSVHIHVTIQEILSNIGRNPVRFKSCLVSCNLVQAISSELSPDWQLDFY